MVLKTEAQVIKSMEKAINATSPQIRIDTDKGTLFYTSIRAVAPVIAEISADVARLDLLSTYQFPNNVSSSEMVATARAFGVGLGTGGFSFGLAYFITGQLPVGNEVFSVQQGATVTTSSSVGVRALSFAALQTRQMTAGNAASFYVPSRRRYEMPVLVQALAAGVDSNIAPGSLRNISSGAAGFDTVTNLTKFSGGEPAKSSTEAYARVQTKMAGLEVSSRGGVLSVVRETNVDLIQDAALTYGSEYPVLFYRVPDGPAADIWVLNTPSPTQALQSYTGTSGQTVFPLASTPVLSLISVSVNGSIVPATLEVDSSLAYSGSTRENSVVTLATPVGPGDIVDVAYNFDSVIVNAQKALAPYGDADTGELYSTDMLVRTARTQAVVVSITATTLPNFEKDNVAADIEQIVGTFLPNGNNTSEVLGGVRNPLDLVQQLRANVAGLNQIYLNVFCRKSIGSIVETIDILRNSTLVFEDAADLTISVS